MRPGPAAGRYQVHAARRLLLLDTGTGELWFWRQGGWHLAARPPAGGPRDEAPEAGEEIYWEAPGSGAAEGQAQPSSPEGAPPEVPGGRAETIEMPPQPARRR